MKYLFIIFLSIALMAQDSDFNIKKSWNGYEGSKLEQLEISPGGKLIMKNIKGDILIEGSDKSRLRCKEIFTVKTHNKSEVREIFLENRSYIEKNDNAVIITGQNNYENYYSRFEIIIPKNYSIDTKTKGGDITALKINGVIKMQTAGGDLEGDQIQGDIVWHTTGGDVSIENSGGKIDIQTEGGDIELENIKSEIKIRSSGGDIQVYNLQGSGSAKTSGGDIDINLLEGTHFAAVTSGGDITIDNSSIDIQAKTFGGDIRISKAAYKLELNTSGGDISLDRLEGDLSAESSGGDIAAGNIIGSAFIKTAGGDITVKSINKDLDISSSGGDITVKQAYSNIKAVSSGGDIFIKKFNNTNTDKNYVNLASSGGNLTCYLEKNISARIHARIKMRRDKYKIYSEIPLQTNKKQSHGTYILSGEASLNEGHSLIELKTDEGHIRIKTINNE